MILLRQHQLLVTTLTPLQRSLSLPGPPISLWCFHHPPPPPQFAGPPLLFPSLRALSEELGLCKTGLNYGNLSLNICALSELRTDLFQDPFFYLAVHHIIRNLLQHQSSKSSMLLLLPSPTSASIEGAGRYCGSHDSDFWTEPILSQAHSCHSS